MNKKLRLLLMALSWMAIASIARAQDANTSKVLRAHSVFAEAESFKAPEGWVVAEGHGIDMYSPAVSGGKTLHPVTEGSATLDVKIPRDGAYAMWVWHTKWAYDRSFELRVEQGGEIIAASVFNRPEDKQGNWSYNLQKGEAIANLKAGAAKLILFGPAQGANNGTAIDAILLTSAENYPKPDWNDFSPQAFVRFTMLSAQAPPVKAAVSSRLHHTPWRGAAPEIAGENGAPVAPNQPSAWSDISKSLSTGESPATVVFNFQGDAPLPPTWKLRLEIASQPDEKSILKTIEEEWDGDAAAYVMPGDVPRFFDRIESIAAITSRHLKTAESFKLPGGVGDFRPKIISIEGSANSFSPRLTIAENDVLAKMGINVVPPHIGKKLEGSAVKMDASKSWFQWFIHDIGLTDCAFDPALQAKLENTLNNYAADFKKNDPVSFASVRGVILADEPHTPHGLKHMTTHAPDWEAFRAWLQKRGATPQEFGMNNWAEIKPVLPDAKATVELRRLGYLSAMFAQESTPLPFLRATQIVQKAFGRPIQTRTNFSDEALNGFGATMSDGDKLNWFEFGRMNATTLPYTEDFLYSNPHLTPLLADLLRSTQTTQNVPLGMYIIWGYSPSTSPHSAELRTISAAGRGVKTFNHYWYGPHYASTEVAFSEDEKYLRSIAYGNRVLGLADDVLGRAMPPSRQVAILWSQATEIWKPDDAFSIERRMLHHALSMQQIPVDFIDEKDVLSRLDEYKVLFLPANNLPIECAQKISAWVEAGGTLIVSGGGPERDEANEPTSALLKTMGLQNVEMKKDAQDYRSEIHSFNALKPSTPVALAGQNKTIPVAGYKAVLTPLPQAKVLGEYQGGGAAIVEYSRGKGRALSFGFNPGISLLMAMEPNSLAQKPFWNVFPETELKLISAPIFEAGVQRPVSTQIGIDAARLDGPDGSAITLANFTSKPIGKLRLLVRDVKASKAVSSVRGPLAIQNTKDGIVLELPLDTVDVVKLTR